MATYYLNWCGPINMKWLEENGTQWSGGRIDVADGSTFGSEYTVRPILSEDWYAWGEWMNSLETDEVLTFNQLVDQFIEQGGELRWWLDAGFEYKDDKTIEEGR